ncbi:50S ribosomal protein L6 [Candidatus Peregrinibacteria bacterium]|nr:MAG: 50S ribosomal protein L6 [Candidatus Peregrinibacteria bacterium]
MSLIGKRPITIPSGVEITLQDTLVKVKGTKGELEFAVTPEYVTVLQQEGEVVVKRKGDSKEAKAFHGLTRSIINNMIIGVSKGFEKKLEVIGVGYRAAAAGKKVTLNLGFSHPVEYAVMEGVLVEMDKENKNMIIVSGIDKQKVGQVAAEIRSYREPEPYKGKGIRYKDEFVRRKAGKTASK